MQKITDLINEVKTRQNEVEAHLDRSKSALSFMASQRAELRDANIGHYDHQIDLAKFFIGLSSTAIFTSLGLGNQLNGYKQLLIVAFIVLIISVMMLFKLSKKRSGLIERLNDQMLKEITLFTDDQKFSKEMGSLLRKIYDEK